MEVMRGVLPLQIKVEKLGIFEKWAVYPFRDVLINKKYITFHLKRCANGIGVP